VAAARKVVPRRVAPTPADGGVVTVQVLGLSDWHGQLDPSGTPPGEKGGAAELAAYFRAEREAFPRTVIVSGGDAVGATPPLSSHFRDVPSIRALNLMTLDVAGFGNHEFDRGLTSLQDLVNLADFPFVSSNLDHLAQNLTGVDTPWTMVDLGGIKLAVVGTLDPATHAITMSGAMGTLRVTDPVAGALAARDRARQAGATLFVLTTHIGVNGPASGPLLDYASELRGFDVIVGGHTHHPGVSLSINGASVVQGDARGISYARVRMQVSTATGGVVSKTAEVVPTPSSKVHPDPAVQALLADYRAQLGPIMDQPMGVATEVYPDNYMRARESALGNLIADAVRLLYGVQLVLVNSGAIRSSLPSSYLPKDHALRRPTSGFAAGPPYDLVRGDTFTALPFGNLVITRTVTGAQVWAMLENGLGFLPSKSGAFPQVSGMRVVYDTSRPAGQRVISVTREDGTPIKPDDVSYTLAVPDYVNSGGDGYTMLKDGQGVVRDLLADVVVQYIGSVSPVNPSVDGRLTAR
jgi:5'-nucleotidase